MARSVSQLAQTSMTPIQLTSSDTPQTFAEGITALSTDNTVRTFTGHPNANQEALGGQVIVSGNAILVGEHGLTPSLANYISTTLTAVAVADAGELTSAITGIKGNQVTLTPASMTNIQAGLKVVITVTDNYNGTFFVESVTTTTFNIAATFVAETTSTSDLIKSPTVNVGVPVAAGEIYEMTSSKDVSSFRYVSAVAGSHGTMDIDLGFGG